MSERPSEERFNRLTERPWRPEAEGKPSDEEIHLRYNQAISIERDFPGAIEVHFQDSATTPPLFLTNAKEFPQLGAEYLLSQPDVMRADPRRGWAPIGGRHESTVVVGYYETPQFKLGPEVEGEQVGISLAQDDRLIIDNAGDPVTVRAPHGSVKERF